MIGIGCRLPGASDPDAFWDMLENGREGIREVPAARWPIDEYFDPDPDAPGKMSARMGGFLDEIDRVRSGFLRHRSARSGHDGSAAAASSRGRLGSARKRGSRAGKPDGKQDWRLRRHLQFRLPSIAARSRPVHDRRLSGVGKRAERGVRPPVLCHGPPRALHDDRHVLFRVPRGDPHGLSEPAPGRKFAGARRGRQSHLRA